MIRNALWFRVFDALTPFAHSQEQCEKMTNAAVAAMKPQPRKPPVERTEE